MKKQILFLILPFLLFANISFSQDYKIDHLTLNFDGIQLLISYDLLTNNKSDLFNVWVEIVRKDGGPILPKTISGDIGDTKAGMNKQIIYVPGKDSVFLNEEVFVEVKAERYSKLFNKSSMILLSTVMPGLGQTKIAKGKPWWLTGIAVYGTLSGGFIVHSKSVDTYKSYKIEEDPVKRKELLTLSQKQLDISDAMIVSGALLWVANIFWVAATPNRYQPLKHVNLSLNQSNGFFNRTTLLTMRINF